LLQVSVTQELMQLPIQAVAVAVALSHQGEPQMPEVVEVDQESL
jgi:hypothetical protein